MAKEKTKGKKADKTPKDRLEKKAKKKSLKRPVAGSKPKKDGAKTKSAPSSKKPAVSVTREERIEMIRTAAYYLAQKRSHQGDYEVDDWFEAEEEIDSIID